MVINSCTRNEASFIGSKAVMNFFTLGVKLKIGPSEFNSKKLLDLRNGEIQHFLTQSRIYPNP